MMRGSGSSWIDRIMYVLLGLFIIATIGHALVGGATLLDVNLLTNFQPFQALHGLSTAPTNFCRGDTVDTVMPGLNEIRTRVLAGDFPGWSSAEAGGAPLAGIPNLGQFGPLALPYYLLPLWLAPAFVKLAEFIVAIGGMVLYLRRLRLSAASGVLAGIVFATSGFMLSWTNWPHTRVAAFIPLLFWAIERLIQHHRVVDALPLAMVTVSMLLGGFPAVTGMTLYLAGLYFLIRMLILYRLKWRILLAGTSIAVLGLVLGGALSAFQLLPFVRRLSTMNLAYRNSVGHSAMSTLLTTMVPDAQGLLCSKGESLAGGNPIENLAFIGVAAVLLALVAVTLRSQPSDPIARGVVGFLAIASLFVIVVGWYGGELLTLLIRLPVFSQNPIDRIRSLLGFLLAALVGFGFEKLLRWVRHDAPGPDEAGRTWRRVPSETAENVAVNVDADQEQVPTVRARQFHRVAHVIWPVIVSLAAMAFAAYIFKEALNQARVSGGTAHLRTSLIMPAALLAFSLLALVAARFGARRMRRVSIVVIALIAVGQSGAAFKGSVPGSDPANFYPVTSTHKFLQQNLGFDRFAASGLNMYPATSRYYGLRTPTGHEFTTDAWKALLHAVDPASQLTPTFSDFNVATVNARSVGHIPLLDQMSVRYFVAADFDIVGIQAPAAATSETVGLTAGQVVQCPLSAGPLRAVSVTFAGPLVGSSGVGATVHVRIHTPTGSMTGARSLGEGLKAPALISVAVPAEDMSAGATSSADVWVTGASAPFALAGHSGVPTCGTVKPTADGLKIVASDAGAIVYQRLTSLPRIRWASTSRVEPNARTRVADLKAGIAPTSVLLDTEAPGSDGQSATVRVTAGDGDRLAATVDAGGAGYLVVADSMQQPGWAATIDGRSTELLPANNAMVAVRVPAGAHQVEMTYVVPGQRSGLVISGMSLGLVAAIWLLWWRRRRQAR